MTFYERILLEMRERIALYSNTVCGGGLTHDEYRTATGAIKGIKECENLVLKAYKDCFENTIKD